MPTKTKSYTIPDLTEYYWGTSPSNIYSVDRYNGKSSSGASTITYGSGPRKVDGRCNWKPCDQQLWLPSGPSAALVSENYNGGYSVKRYMFNEPLCSFTGHKQDVLFNADIPESATQTLFDAFWSSIDLNCHDSVMCYSAILQAVPLLGGLLKANVVLNKVGKEFAKLAHHMSFTALLKYAISADFINRFVVQTTLQDLHNTYDATDYVVRTVTTAQSRNLSPAAFQAETSGSTVDKSAPSSSLLGGINLNYANEHGSFWTRKLFTLADVRYDITPLTSLKLLANRLGITRPLESAWDLVPFSFVADYFLRTGEFLSYLSDKTTSISGLEGKVCGIRGAWMTDSVNTGWKSKCTSHTAQSGFKLLTYPQFGYAGSHFFRRYMCPSFYGKSGFWDKGGLFSPRLSTVRSRTIVELVLQAKLR